MLPRGPCAASASPAPAAASSARLSTPASRTSSRPSRAASPRCIPTRTPCSRWAARRPSSSASRPLRRGCAGIADYQTNGDCAAGTGSFMDQQASRLLYEIEDVGDIVLGAGKAASIAGRCSVFAKSDMIHAQQKGYEPPEVLRGLCDAVIRNFRGTIAKGKLVAAAGRLHRRRRRQQGRRAGAARGLRASRTASLFVPEFHFSMGAIGAALHRGRRSTRPGAAADGAARRRPPAGRRLPRHRAAVDGARRAAARHGEALRVACRATTGSTPTWASTSARCPPTSSSSTRPAP